MKLVYTFGITSLLMLWSCQNPSEKENIETEEFIPTEFSEDPEVEGISNENNSITNSQNPNDFIPEGYVEFDKSFADLNKDGLKDCILIIQDTKKENFVQDEYRGELNRNRRGLIIAFKTDKGYKLIHRKLNCFASAEEDGGTYYYPELSVYSEKGLLYIHYAHGRYGFWKYTFRYQNDNFELIGFDRFHHNGPIELSGLSINFSTGKKLIRTNKYINDPEKYEDTEEFIENFINLPKEPLIKLSEIEDFETFDERFEN
jgi:hypothetical protein